MNARDVQLVDQLFGEYLFATEYRSWTGRPTPPVTGYVSSCCRASTRATRTGDLACDCCERRCDSVSLHDALGGKACRGGWQPGVEGDWNWIHVSETRSPRIGATEDRLIHGADRVRFYAELFDAPPRGTTRRAWARTHSAWSVWWSRGKLSYADVAEMAVTSGLPPEIWTGGNVERWIYDARKAVHRRFLRAQSRPREYPWAGRVAPLRSRSRSRQTHRGASRI